MTASPVMAPLILASASPRRAELLTAAGIPFEVEAADIDESPLPGEDAEAYVSRIATDKADVVAARHPGRVILAADTTVVVDGRMLAKPADDGEARAMLRALAGRAHRVLTGVCVACGTQRDTQVVATTVEFAAIGEDELAWYVGSREPMDKAGAYGIQGLASRFITGIQGSYSNVVGLPVSLVYAMVPAELVPGKREG